MYMACRLIFVTIECDDFGCILVGWPAQARKNEGAPNICGGRREASAGDHLGAGHLPTVRALSAQSDPR